MWLRTEIVEFPNTININQIPFRLIKRSNETSKIRALGVTDSNCPLRLQSISETQKDKRYISVTITG